MPIVLGLGLVEVLAILVTFALYYTVKLWAEPLAHALGNVPGIGGHLEHWMMQGINAVLGVIGAFAHVNLALLRDLYHGCAWVLSDLTKAPLDYAHKVEAALHYLRHTVVVALIHAAVHPLALHLARLAHEVENLGGVASRGLTNLLHRVEKLETHLARDIERPLDALIDHAIPDLRAAETAITTELREVVRPEVAAAQAAVGALGRELGGIEAKIDATDLWKVVGGVASLSALVALIENEAGLGRAECRQKVKGICSTDPSAWFGLLAGLTAFGAGFTLADLIELGTRGVSETEGVVEQLVGR